MVMDFSQQLQLAVVVGKAGILCLLAKGRLASRERATKPLAHH